MIPFLESLLAEFKGCFSRKAAWRWFVIIILGLLTRSDHLGVTSVIRALSLDGKHYESLLNFFHSSAYSLGDIKRVWRTAIAKSNRLFCPDGRVLLLGDGTKVSKEGRRMPGVQKLFQESENSSKCPYIFGHMFGGLAAVIGNATMHFATPISMDIHGGLSAMADWSESFGHRAVSHVVRMVENAHEAAGALGSAILCLDRYFLTVPALRRLDELNASEKRVDIVTRAKNNCTAWEEPNLPAVKRRGRPRKKGNAVKLLSLFETRKEDFLTEKAFLYGEWEEVSFLCLDLLWGMGLYRKLRFVLSESSRGRAIFVCTDTSADPVKIIEIYAVRFGIELSFRSLKQQVGGFLYHFWTKVLPGLNRYKKAGEADNLSAVTGEHDRRLAARTVEAVERFVLFSCIAVGLTQLISLNPHLSEGIAESRYLRTKARNKISEATVLEYLRKNLFRLLLLNPLSELTRIILRVFRDDLGENASDIAA